MRVYVAGSFAHKEEAREMMRLLREKGHTITHDWTYESADGLEGVELRRFLCTAAKEDLYGVSVAEALVVLHFSENKGTLVEFGYGLRDRDKILVVVDGDRHYTEVPIFYYVDDRVVHQATRELAAEYLTEWEAIHHNHG